MNSKGDMRSRAVFLRKRGMSYSEIRKHVPVSKSSLSLWLKHVPLPEEMRQRLYTKQIAILSRGAPSQAERRKREVALINEAARKEILLPLSSESLRFLGAALYWAEGSKTDSFSITNSDPALIAFMVHWFEQMFQVPRTLFRAHLNIYSQQNENDIKRFWSEVTGIPIDNFGKSFVKPASKGFKKNNLYYGTIKVRVPKGTDMRHRVYAWIQTALQDLIPEIELHLLRWSSLREVNRPPVNIRP